MKNNVTEVVFILDKSGSMAGVVDDTIGGFNSVLNKQKKIKEGKTYITTVLFDHNIELLHDHMDIDDVNEISEEDYYTGGSTALYDAIGYGVSKIENITKKTDSKVLFVIITDGEENSSKEYRGLQIRKLIDKKSELGWNFMYLGANIDAFASASSIGIKASMTANFIQDSVGMAKSFSAVADSIVSFREAGVIHPQALCEVNEDFKRRKKSK